MPWSVTGGYGWIAVLLGRQAALERIERHQNSKHRPIIANYSSRDKPMNTKQSVYLFYRPSVTTAMTLMNSSCNDHRLDGKLNSCERTSQIFGGPGDYTNCSNGSVETLGLFKDELLFRRLIFKKLKIVVLPIGPKWFTIYITKCHQDHA